MTRDELIEVLESMEPDEVLALLDGTAKLDELIDAAVAEETKGLIADRDAAFDEGKESAVSDMTGDLMEMLAEGRIEDAGQYLESLGSDRPWYMFKACALSLGRLSL
jgi:hypothetical protein